MSEIKHTFGTCETGGRFEVITPDGEVIASFEKESEANDFEMSLNMLCTDAAETPGAVVME